MAKKQGNTYLIQSRVSPKAGKILEKVAKQENLTMASLVRRKLMDMVKDFQTSKS